MTRPVVALLNYALLVISVSHSICRRATLPLCLFYPQGLWKLFELPGPQRLLLLFKCYLRRFRQINSGQLATRHKHVAVFFVQQKTRQTYQELACFSLFRNLFVPVNQSSTPSRLELSLLCCTN